jgi:tetratricopeptide (TPR) repeat protein
MKMPNPCGGRPCEEAIATFEAAVRERPADALGHYQLGLCYSGSCRVHSQVSPEMATAYLWRALALAGAGEFLRASILDALGNTLIRCPDRPRDAALRDAIACHGEAAAMYRAIGNPGDWARTQFNLGNSCCELSEATGEDHWQEAVCHYEKSLEVRTRKENSERYAAVLENLGTAYRRLPGEAAGANVRKSIECYHRALRVCRRSANPARNAALQNNIGNAYLSLPQEDEPAAARNARRALRCFARALRIQSADKRSRAYGITQYNRAQAFFRLARSSPRRNIRFAVTCLEEAGAAFQACHEQRYVRLIQTQLEPFRRGSEPACEHGRRNVQRS